MNKKHMIRPSKKNQSLDDARKNVDDKLEKLIRFLEAGTYDIGTLVEGKGVYFGIWELPPSPKIACKIKDKIGKEKEPPKRFYLFAAPSDLMDEFGHRKKLAFRTAAQEVANIRNLLGHDGAFYDSDTKLFEDLRKNAYGGQWFIPPKTLLDGWDDDLSDWINLDATKKRKSIKVFDSSLYAYSETGAFKGTFSDSDRVRAVISIGDFSMKYWSSTVKNGIRVGSNFTFRHAEWTGSNARLFVRPIRLEAIPAPQ